MVKNKMKNKIALLTIIIGIGGLAGCAPSPSTIGLTQQQWDQASPAIRKCWQTAYQGYKKSHPNIPGAADVKDKVRVTISGGTAAFPPVFNRIAYRTVKDVLPEGACHTNLLSSPSGKYKTKLYICYAKNTIAIDPSHYDKSTTDGSLILTDNPLWAEGFSYHNMNTDGYVKLNNATIRVKSLGQ